MRHVGSVLPRFGHPIWLLILFIASFSLPILFVQAIKAKWTFVPISTRFSNEEPTLFSKVVRIPQDAQTVQVESAPVLSPQRGKPFVLALWIQPRREAKAKDRVPLLTRLDSGTQHRSGYQITVEGEGESIRPRVYWQDGSAAGGWYLFNEFTAEPRVWYLLALSLTNDRYLGLHVATYRAGELKPEIRLLGGYELSEPVTPNPDAPLLIGSYRGSFLRSEFGALGVGSFSASEELAAFLRSIARQPANFLDEVTSGAFFDAELKDRAGVLSISAPKGKRNE